MDARTQAVIRWVLEWPVLTLRLAEIVRDEALYKTEELPCTVADLLYPGRGFYARAYLSAVGVPRPAADAVWQDLSGGDTESWQWMNAVDWYTVRSVLRMADDRREKERWA